MVACLFVLLLQQLAGELVVVNALTQRHTPFALLQYVSPVIRHVFSSSPIAKDWQCSREKARTLIREVSGPMFHDDLVDLMRKGFFSLMIDESQCITVVQHMALVVKVADLRQSKVGAYLLGMYRKLLFSSGQCQNDCQTGKGVCMDMLGQLLLCFVTVAVAECLTWCVRCADVSPPAGSHGPVQAGVT